MNAKLNTYSRHFKHFWFNLKILGVYKYMCLHRRRIHTHCEADLFTMTIPFMYSLIHACITFAYRLSSQFQRPGTNEWITTATITTTKTTITAAATLNSALIHKNEFSSLSLSQSVGVCVCFFCLPNASLMTLWLIFFLHIFVMFCAQCSQLDFMRIVAIMVVCIVFLSFCSFGYFCVLVIFILTHIVCEYVFCECKCQMCTATPKSMCLISISFVILIFQTRTKKNIISNKICVKYTTSPLKHSVRQLRWIRPLQWNNFSLKNDVQMNIKR